MCFLGFCSCWTQVLIAVYGSAVTVLVVLLSTLKVIAVWLRTSHLASSFRVGSLHNMYIVLLCIFVINSLVGYHSLQRLINQSNLMNGNK